MKFPLISLKESSKNIFNLCSCYIRSQDKELPKITQSAKTTLYMYIVIHICIKIRKVLFLHAYPYEDAWVWFLHGAVQ